MSNKKSSYLTVELLGKKKKTTTCNFLVSFVGDLLSTSSSAANILASVVSASFASVKELVSTEVSHVSEKITQHENLSLNCKAELLRLIVSKFTYSYVTLNI